MWWRRRRPLRLLVAFCCCAALAALLTGAKRKRRSPQADLAGRRSVVMFNEDSYMQSERRSAGSTTEKHGFNLRASEAVRSDRQLPDTRQARCKGADHEISSSASVSVIISFHNEARSALLRTVVSVLNRTPEDLLQEIILVDDTSSDEGTGRLLLALPKVKLLRQEQRQGLIRSRIRGAAAAAGSHLVFLDSHCEVNTQWLEPLLEVVTREPRAVVSPVTDVIDPQTFQYQPASAHLRGGFDWSLHYRWLNSSSSVQPGDINPFTSPVIPGGMFLISKDWFDQLGQFDPELDIWGAEHLELSLKTWMCGGRVLIAPCSRIGHVFRGRHPYTFPEGNVQTYLRNSKRVAETWLDEYKRFFYRRRPAAAEVPAVDVSQRRALRHRLQCRTFGWYITEVYPEIRPPAAGQLAYGALSQDGRCAAVGRDGLLALSACSAAGRRRWALSRDGRLLAGAGLCAVGRGPRRAARVARCTGSRQQEWLRHGRTLVHAISSLCLDGSRPDQLQTRRCAPGLFTQTWDFTVELQTRRPADGGGHP